MSEIKSSIVKLTSVFILSFVFLGCAPTYNIEPNYDKKSKVLMIDSYKINDIIYNNANSNHNLTSADMKFSSFNTNNNVCRRIMFKEYNVGQNMWYINSGIDDILTAYNGNCVIEKIGNLNFFKCNEENKRIIGKSTTTRIIPRYGITSSRAREQG